MGLNKLNHNFSYPLKESSADIDVLKAGTVQAGATTVIAGTGTTDMVQYKSATGAVMANVGYDGSINSPNFQPAGKNFAYNGGMDIWQRGNGPWLDTGGPYADRWTYTINNGGGPNSWKVAQSVDVPNARFGYSIEYTSNSSVPTGMVEWAARQTYDLQSVRPLAGQYVTVSFWYKSNIVGPHAVRIGNTFGVGQSGGADQNITFNVNKKDTWEFKSVVFTNFLDITNWGVIAPTAFATFLDLGFRTGNKAGQTALYAGGYFRFTGLQMEIGTVATPFTRMGGNYYGELELCRRWFQRYTNAMPGRPVQIDVANRPEWLLAYSTKRTNPVITVTNPANIAWVYITTSGSVNTTTGFAGTLVGTGLDEADLFFNTSSGLSAYTLFSPEFIGTVYIDISCEI